MKNLALRIFDKDVLYEVITTRSGLKVNDATGEVDNDLSAFNGKTFILYDIGGKTEIGRGDIVQGQLEFSKDKKGKKNIAIELETD